LIKKVDSLEKKVKELKHENKAIEKEYDTKKIVALPEQKKASIGFTSNLINIRVQGQNLHLKEDILEELKTLREKVSILENRSNDISSVYQRNSVSPSRMNRYQFMAPDLLAESNVEHHSKLAYSDARKPTGKIIKKSDSRAIEHARAGSCSQQLLGNFDQSSVERAKVEVQIANKE
jgi:hypothetical protein